MSEPLLLPVKPGSLSRADMRKLSAAGIIVVQHECPGDLRLIKPSLEISAGDILRCALKALVSSADYGAREQRFAFLKMLSESMESRKP